MRIEQVVPPSVFVRGVDFVDGTPVLDIKPYVGAFDAPYGGPTCCGWFETVDRPGGATPDGLRPDMPHERRTEGESRCG